MNERYPLPTKDLKTGTKVLGKVLEGTYEGAKPALKVIAHHQAERLLKAILRKEY